MAFPGLQKWAARYFRANKPEGWRHSRANVFRPVVEQLECRQLLSTVFPISLANGGPSVTPNGDSSIAPTVSADGRFIGFTSQATNIVPGQTDTNGARDVFLYDRLTGTTVLVTHTSNSTITAGNGDSLV